MINKAIIRQVIVRELGAFFGPLGFRVEKVKGDIVASMIKDDCVNHYGFHCHTNKYNEYKLVYSFSFGINKVVEVLKEIDGHVPLTKPRLEISGFLTGTSPGYRLDPFDPERGYKYFTTEEGLLQILEDVKAFYRDEFLPFCETYSDVVKLDKLINCFDDFWMDSLGKPVPLRFFHVTRLIVAKLANNPHFDEVVERNFQALEELWKRDGGVYDRFNESKPEVFTAKYLKERSFG